MQSEMDMSRRTVSKAGASLCLATLIGIAIQPVSGDEEADPEPEVQFPDQESDGTSLTVAYAATDVDAFVVIERDEFGDVVGDHRTRINLNAGESVEDVELEPDDGQLAEGTHELTARLHESGGSSLDFDDATVQVDDADDDDGAADGENDEDDEEADPEPEVQFPDQETDGTTLTVAYAATDVDAFVVIERDEFGDVVGDHRTRINLNAGESVEDVELEPDDGQLAEGTHELTARLHESGGSGLDFDDATVQVGDSEDDDGEADDTDNDDGVTDGADNGETDTTDDDPGDDQADTADDADDDGPGFGVAGALTGLGSAAYMLRRRFDGSDVED